MSQREHPFIDLVGLTIAEQRAGYSRCTVRITRQHFNTLGAVHGAVLFALADTGMGAALYPALEAGQTCATVEVKINYFRPVTEGEVVCESVLVHRGRTMANLEASLRVGGTLVAKANGTFAILTRRDTASS